MPNRKQRSHDTQNAVAAWYRGNGFPHAESAGAGRPGVDVLGMPGCGPEVKARRDLRLPEWLRQARRAGTSLLPWVVHRPDGMGPATIGDWPVTMRLEDHTALLRAAGYGEPEATA